ncbi:2,5-dioxovalerate dehydrogenase [Saccharospirillum sp. MSK14-1]|uniref:aldehyde dehydrogenase (NADP(+)) n=1 Tax=Saccharospirillum sp. MSK14-1 TaxID=1897632 RepID=UPI000D384043|nr:aldehyde dehydrogenase (NADP(+)) [Saccharospirillum sp. MSK14-1]PTY35640.1 2,5-dioxovalerate dehydrogenase [Saccharospirillum sp. MSK14-1]
MSITGKQLIGGNWQAGDAGSYQAVNPATGESIGPELSFASEEQVRAATAAAAEAAPVFATTSLEDRAAFLDACAEEIMALGDALLERVSLETGYPLARAENERGRTCNQLKMFAGVVRAGDFLDVRIDSALPERTPPRPDLRFVKQALGPIAVFGSSNFPLAFSAGGGDTASALAAGCPVIVKSHNSHPGSGELVAQALAKAAEKCAMPAGVINFLAGEGNAIGAQLVTDAKVKAVGFTGSYRGGSALQQLASNRPDPIPFFGEMGSINPLVVLPEALRADAENIASGFVGSLTLGTGQFCVNPGLVFGIAGDELETFINATAQALNDQPAGVMLNQGVAGAYQKGADTLAQQSGVKQVAAGAEPGAQGYCGQARLYRVSAQDFLANLALQEEVFGPTSLVVVCDNAAQLTEVTNALSGQLTGTLHGTDAELGQHASLIRALEQRVGRLVFNGFPTGVEVCEAMMHGGPHPASSDTRFTSVGTAAIDRWLRPVCYQNSPAGVLPPALQDANPWQLRRRVDGQWQTGSH